MARPALSDGPEQTGEREKQDQLLDSMDLERERGYDQGASRGDEVSLENGQNYRLNLLDTPGHVTSLKVSRSLAAVTALS